MTDLRRKRLLWLATTPNADHKRYYSQYCELMGEGLVMWCMETASLTHKGQNRLTAYMLDDLATMDQGLV